MTSGGVRALISLAGVGYPSSDKARFGVLLSPLSNSPAMRTIIASPIIFVVFSTENPNCFMVPKNFILLKLQEDLKSNKDNYPFDGVNSRYEFHTVVSVSVDLTCSL